MNLNQILKELDIEFKHRDKNGFLRALGKIPDIYPFLNEQQVLILQTEYPKLKEQIETCKWMNLTRKMIEQISPKERAKKMIRQLRGEPEPRNIDDDIKAFINLLSSFGFEEDKEKPKHLMTLTVILTQFKVSRATLQRATEDGRLKTYPQSENAAANAAQLVDAVEVAKLWPKRPKSN